MSKFITRTVITGYRHNLIKLENGTMTAEGTIETAKAVVTRKELNAILSKKGLEGNYTTALIEPIELVYEMPLETFIANATLKGEE